MIKDYQKQLNRLHIVLDALVIIISYLGSWFFLFGERPTTGVLLHSMESLDSMHQSECRVGEEKLPIFVRQIRLDSCFLP